MTEIVADVIANDRAARSCAAVALRQHVADAELSGDAGPRHRKPF